jgi:hypothetical protein
MLKEIGLEPGKIGQIGPGMLAPTKGKRDNPDEDKS